MGKGNKHGYSKKPVYGVWADMLNRCNNLKNARYYSYGGRGIKVCKHWYKFENFLIDMGEPSPKMSIDRINPNGNYELKNCRWATAKQQARNTRGWTNSSSSKKGVSRINCKKSPWQARITISGKSKYIGCFKTENAAALAYNKVAKKAWGNNAYLNKFPKLKKVSDGM